MTDKMKKATENLEKKFGVFAMKDEPRSFLDDVEGSIGAAVGDARY